MGELVEFQLGHGNQGPIAESVTRPGGKFLPRSRRYRRRRVAAVELLEDICNEGEERMADNLSNDLMSCKKPLEDVCNEGDERMADNLFNDLMPCKNNYDGDEDKQIVTVKLCNDVIPCGEEVGDSEQILTEKLCKEEVPCDISISNEARADEREILNDFDPVVKQLYLAGNVDIFERVATPEVAKSIITFRNWVEGVKNWRSNGKRKPEDERDSVCKLSRKIQKDCAISLREWGLTEKNKVWQKELVKVFALETLALDNYLREKFGVDTELLWEVC